MANYKLESYDGKNGIMIAVNGFSQEKLFL